MSSFNKEFTLKVVGKLNQIPITTKISNNKLRKQKKQEKKQNNNEISDEQFASIMNDNENEYEKLNKSNQFNKFNNSKQNLSFASK
jgi:isopropylmalate/homocitrate/citramalate synthase